MSRWSEIRSAAVLFEDEAILVLDKPAGVSVMGERHEADLVTLAAEDGEELFPVHRIDKVTSGVVLFAKRLRYHGDLTRQFNKRTVSKAYLAITRVSQLPERTRQAGPGLPGRGTIDLPLGVGRKNRVRVAGERGDIVVAGREGREGPDGGVDGAGPRTRGGDGNGWRWSLAAVGGGDRDEDGAPGGAGGWGSGKKKSYPSRTDFVRAWADDENALLAVRPVTGRRHQIRVHLAWIGHPIEGDPLFDRAAAESGARCALHAWRLSFDAAWAGGARLDVEAAPGADFWGVLGARGDAVASSGALDGVREAVSSLDARH